MVRLTIVVWSLLMLAFVSWPISTAALQELLGGIVVTIIIIWMIKNA